MDIARLKARFALAASLRPADGQDADQFTACPRSLGDHRPLDASRANHDAGRAGPTPRVAAMAARLTSRGVTAEHIHVTDSGWSKPCP